MSTDDGWTSRSARNERWQSWRTRAAPKDAGLQKSILELDGRAGAAQQEPPAAHVTAADKAGRIVKTPAEKSCEHIDIFSRGDAAKQHHPGVVRQLGGERRDVALQRRAIPDIINADVDSSELTQGVRRH